MTLSPDQLAALIAATSFAAGLNVYATVATLGLLARAQALRLPPSLHLVETWPVIAICAVMFVIEFTRTVKIVRPLRLLRRSGSHYSFRR